MTIVSELNDDADGRPLTKEHFLALSSIHGLHVIPEGKGKIHYMKPGALVLLDGEYDSWVPLPDEPLSDQIRRVSLTDRERARREAVRLEYVEIYKKSPLYRQRADANPTYWETFHPGGLL
ncbi:MAG: hypothetical protein LT106_12995 [Burkholderiaceae bacterium]|nr:hypothetical protein [Burkholderiaceae bacterium]